jgi:hypothetical protein
MERFPAYTWTALNDEDPEFMRAIMIQAVGTRDLEGEADIDDES